MLETVIAFIEEHQLLPASGEIVVAVSGGADSLCLLHILHRLCGPGKRYPEVRLHAAHLNHKLRGEASAKDAAAVAQLVASWEIPCTLGEVDVPALAREERRSLEDAARIARYRFLREAAHGQPIAVAHHADDQVETLVLHWMRGEGLAGSVGMLPRQQDIIRPLLEVRHAQTVAYCAQQGIVPLEDASNTDSRFLRNRIRHELLPLLESLNPAIHTTLLRNAQVMRVDFEWIEAQVNEVWSSVVLFEQPDTIRLSISALLALPLSLQRHLLRHITASLCAGQSPLTLRHYLLIEELVHRTGVGEERVLHLPKPLQVRRHLDELLFERQNIRDDESSIFSSSGEEVLLPIPGQVDVPGTPFQARAETLPDELAQEVRQALQREDWPEVWQLLPSRRYTVYIDGDAIGSFLAVRTRSPGDRIRPLGMEREKKVQDVLVDKHIPRRERGQIPLFFSDSHCIWVAGVSIDDRVRLDCWTQHIVRLSIVTT